MSEALDIANRIANENCELRAILKDAQHFILSRHNMGARQREKQRLYVLRGISSVLKEKQDEYRADQSDKQNS